MAEFPRVSCTHEKQPVSTPLTAIQCDLCGKVGGPIPPVTAVMAEPEPKTSAKRDEVTRAPLLPLSREFLRDILLTLALVNLMLVFHIVAQGEDFGRAVRFGVEANLFFSMGCVLLLFLEGYKPSAPQPRLPPPTPVQSTNVQAIEGVVRKHDSHFDVAIQSTPIRNAVEGGPVPDLIAEEVERAMEYFAIPERPQIRKFRIAFAVFLILGFALFKGSVICLALRAAPLVLLVPLLVVSVGLAIASVVCLILFSKRLSAARSNFLNSVSDPDRPVSQSLTPTKHRCIRLLLHLAKRGTPVPLLLPVLVVGGEPSLIPAMRFLAGFKKRIAAARGNSLNSDPEPDRAVRESPRDAATSIRLP
jgi:hypothetical protein